MFNSHQAIIRILIVLRPNLHFQGQLLELCTHRCTRTNITTDIYYAYLILFHSHILYSTHTSHMCFSTYISHIFTSHKFYSTHTFTSHIFYSNHTTYQIYSIAHTHILFHTCVPHIPYSTHLVVILIMCECVRVCMCACLCLCACAH